MNKKILGILVVIGVVTVIFIANGCFGGGPTPPTDGGGETCEPQDS